jgi:hypothetical protein
MREGELVPPRQVFRLEPLQLHEVVTGARVAVRVCRPRETEDDAAVVRLEPVTEEPCGLDLERGLLADLSTQRIERVLVFVEKAAREVPEAGPGILRPPTEQHAPAFVEADRLRAGDGVRVGDEPARGALRAVCGPLDSLAADGTEPPAVEDTHAEHLKAVARAKPARPLWSAPPSRRLMSPRAAGATQHELSRIGLLATLPGETLARLAQHMLREDIPAGAGVFSEGEEGDRFYVVLSGMLAVSQQSIGAQAVLRPGDYFGEVALAMHMPRTASVRALTPATVASCDQATFDEFIRPLFADD